MSRKVDNRVRSGRQRCLRLVGIDLQPVDNWLYANLYFLFPCHTRTETRFDRVHLCCASISSYTCAHLDDLTHAPQLVKKLNLLNSQSKLAFEGPWLDPSQNYTPYFLFPSECQGSQTSRHSQCLIFYITDISELVCSRDTLKRTVGHALQ